MNAEIVKPLTDWYRANRRDLPWRHTSDPYRIWVSEIMLQQTRVESVKAYYQRFLEALPDLSALAEADEERLLKLWEGLGYYSRVRNMQRAARTVVEDFKGAFPRTKEEMEKLPGIGSYTAGAVASIAFGERVPAVDGNVLRVWARMTADDRNILLPSVKKEAERDIAGLMQTLPAARTSGQDHPGAFHENAAGDFNQALIELGALLCLPGEKPLCEACPVRPFCGAERRGLAGVLPIREKKTERRIERRTVLLVRSGELTAVRKRPDSGLLAGMYEFPNVRGELTAEQAAALREVDALSPGQTALLYGVTGSGKTEVYLRCIEACLQQGKGAIVLVPEIALTPQTVGRFAARFGDRIAVLHSRLSAGERFDEWRRIRLGKAPIVIGARSAVFAPVEDLGLVIIDEEHESSYQSEITPRYHALDIARRRVKASGGKLLLGSATPSILSVVSRESREFSDTFFARAIRIGITLRGGGASARAADSFAFASKTATSPCA